MTFSTELILTAFSALIDLFLITLCTSVSMVTTAKHFMLLNEAFTCLLSRLSTYFIVYVGLFVGTRHVGRYVQHLDK